MEAYRAATDATKAADRAAGAVYYAFNVVSSIANKDLAAAKAVAKADYDAALLAEAEAAAKQTQ